MAISKQTLRALVALQDQDSALDKLDSEAAKVRAEIEAVKGDMERAKGVFAEVKSRAITLEKQKKEKELELAHKDEAVRKHSMELNQVKTNEAFKALQTEIDRAKADSSALETGILECMVALDGCRSEEKRLSAGLKADEDKFKAEIAGHEKSLAEIQARRDGVAKMREEMVTGVGPEALRVYQHIRSRGKANAVVAINGDLCGACRVSLTSQVIVEATKVKDLVICESCQRILYRPEALVDKVQAGA